MMTLGATLSEDRRHRLRLFRTWNPDVPPLLYVMLNPSTADGCKDDPTVKKCIGFALNAGFGGIIVHNLFTLRATDPRNLRLERDLVFAGYDAMILKDAQVSSQGICLGWGRIAKTYWPRAEEVKRLLAPFHLLCLGWTADQQPRHPLFVPYKKKFEDWQHDHTAQPSVCV